MSRPKPVIAQFIGSDRCAAEGSEVRANAPGLAMCRSRLRGQESIARRALRLWIQCEQQKNPEKRTSQIEKSGSRNPFRWNDPVAHQRPNISSRLSRTVEIGG